MTTEYAPYYFDAPLVPVDPLASNTTKEMDFSEVSFIQPKPEEQLFAQALLRNESTNDVFELVETYHNICNESAESLRNQLLSETQLTQGIMSATQKLKSKELELLDGEKNTWLLLHDIEKDRKQPPSEMDLGNLSNKFISDKKLIESVLLKDRELRQQMIVVDWLEAIVEESEEFFRQDILWKHTIYALKHSSGGIMQRQQIVTELDPDATARQARRLHPDDAEDEIHLMHRLWTLVRQGKLKDAQQLCRDCGQPWRAATFSGGQLYHDPELAGDTNPYEGNPFRTIWRESCCQLSQDGSSDPHERAIYATLCGNLTHILPVCRNWEDYLWAYFKVLVDYKINQCLKERFNPLLQEDIVSPATPTPKQEHEIFSELRNHINPDIRAGAHDRYHILQEKIILGKIDEMFVELASWMSDIGFHNTERRRQATASSQFMRFAAHLVLFFFDQGLTRVSEENLHKSKILNACTNILLLYIQHLIHERQVNLVALYTSKLPTSLQVATYANFLKDIRDNAEREKCLLLAERAHLNVPQITKVVVELIRNSTQEDLAVADGVTPSNVITTDDIKKIKAVEWLCFDPSQRAEALIQSNYLARAFIAAHKLEAASKLFEEVLPQDAVAVVLDQPSKDAAIKNAIKEHLCIKVFLECHKAYNKWYSHHVSCPAAPRKPYNVGSQRLAEDLYYKEKLKLYQEQKAAWQQTDSLLSQRAEELIRKVIVYPRGWLTDDVDDEVEFVQLVNSEGYQARSKQLEALRRQCIPNLFFLWHGVLAEEERESLFLADLVADDYQKLYLLFSKEELEHFLFLIRKNFIWYTEKKAAEEASQINS